MSENDYDFNLRIEKLENTVKTLSDDIENLRSISTQSLDISLDLLDIIRHQCQGSLYIAESVKNLADQVTK